jgi:hypothetical protein
MAETVRCRGSLPHVPDLTCYGRTKAPGRSIPSTNKCKLVHSTFILSPTFPPKHSPVTLREAAFPPAVPISPPHPPGTLESTPQICSGSPNSGAPPRGCHVLLSPPNRWWATQVCLAHVSPLMPSPHSVLTWLPSHRHVLCNLPQPTSYNQHAAVHLLTWPLRIWRCLLLYPAPGDQKAKGDGLLALPPHGSVHKGPHHTFLLSHSSAGNLGAGWL